MSNFIAQCMAPMRLADLERMYSMADAETNMIDESGRKDDDAIEIYWQCMAEMSWCAGKIGEWMA